MAELLFRGWVSPHADVAVSSAGTEALIGHSMDASSAGALSQLGIDPSHHRARQFELWMAADADLILTAERAHRDLVMTQLPRAFRRTFTMKEFARLSSHLEPGSPRRAIAEAARHRGIHGRVPEADDNMPDPYRGALEQAKSIAQQVTETVHATLGALDLRSADAQVPILSAPARVSRPSPRRRPRPAGRPA
jgi:protein-tyrosine phosphatase